MGVVPYPYNTDIGGWMLTREKMDALKVLADRASKGPWRVGSVPDKVWSAYEESKPGPSAVCQIIEDGTAADRDLIATSRLAVPLLLDLVDSLVTQISDIHDRWDRGRSIGTELTALGTFIRPLRKSQ